MLEQQGARSINHLIDVFLELGQRATNDLGFLHELERPVAEALKDEPILSASNGLVKSQLAFSAPGILPIPGRDGLWQLDHVRDPLCGTFDAWSARV